MRKKSRRTVQDGVDGPSGKAKLQADYRVTSLRQFLICNFRILSVRAGVVSRQLSVASGWNGGKARARRHVICCCAATTWNDWHATLVRLK